MAVAVGANVMRRDRLARQIVFGDDDMGGAAFGPRQRFQFVIPDRAVAQIYRRQIGGKLGDNGGINFDRRDAHLHPGLDRIVGVARHALQYGHELFGIECRTDDSLQRVAAHALHQRPLLFGRAGHAHEPLGVGELGGKIGGLGEVDRNIGRRRAKFDGLWAGEIVTRGAYAQRVMPGRQSTVRKLEAALRITDNRNRDRRARFLRANQNAFHRAFGGGANGARQRLRKGSLCLDTGEQQRDCGDNATRPRHSLFFMG